MTSSRFAKLQDTAKEQQRAEADGGYAAGDSPYYDADAIIDLLGALREIVEGYPHDHGGGPDVAACPVCYAAEVLESE